MSPLRIVKTLLAALAAAVLTAIVVVAGLIAFGASSPPQAPAGGEAPLEQVDYRDLPPLQTFSARDGVALAYRAYEGSGKQIVVMLHGAAGSSFMLHTLAKAAQAAGYTVYVPDLRGHGASGVKGDIAYNGQLQDDLADFASWVHRARPAASLALLGHSAGGCLALRFAGGPDGAVFERYVLLSPMLVRDAPTVRPGVGGYAKPFKARYVGLTLLDRFGVHRWEGLPVLAFAVPAARVGMMTPLYSYRLSQNLTQDARYRDDLRRSRKPMAILVGGDDELFFADKFAPLVHSLRADVPVSVVPGVGHLGMLVSPVVARQALAALSGAQP